MYKIYGKNKNLFNNDVLNELFVLMGGDNMPLKIGILVWFPGRRVGFSGDSSIIYYSIEPPPPPPPPPNTFMYFVQ